MEEGYVTVPNDDQLSKENEVLRQEKNKLEAQLKRFEKLSEFTGKHPMLLQAFNSILPADENPFLAEAPAVVLTPTQSSQPLLFLPENNGPTINPAVEKRGGVMELLDGLVNNTTIPTEPIPAQPIFLPGTEEKATANVVIEPATAKVVIEPATPYTVTELDNAMFNYNINPSVENRQLVLKLFLSAEIEAAQVKKEAQLKAQVEKAQLEPQPQQGDAAITPETVTNLFAKYMRMQHHTTQQPPSPPTRVFSDILFDMAVSNVGKFIQDHPALVRQTVTTAVDAVEAFLPTTETILQTARANILPVLTSPTTRQVLTDIIHAYTR